VRYIVLCLLVIAAPSVALVDTIQVAALVPGYDDWILGAGADKVVAVNGPDDDDATYINGVAPGALERYLLASHAIPAGSTINIVSVRDRTRYYQGGPPTHRVGVALGEDVVESGFIGITNVYQDFTTPLTRPGGGDWTLGDLDTVGVYVKRTTGYPRVTSLWVIVDYTPPQMSVVPALLRME